MMNYGKIVLISPFFYPEPISTGKYNTHFIKALRQRWPGEIDVITLHPFYPQWNVEPSNEELDGITIHRGGERIKFSRHPLLRRLVLEVYFYFYVRQTLRHLVRASKLSGVVCIVPPSLFASCSQWLRRKGIPAIGIIHDLQSIHAKASQSALAKIGAKVIELIESRIFRKFRHVVFLSHKMRSHGVSELGLSAAATSVSYPFATTKEHAQDNGTADLEELLPATCRHIVYSGALGAKQNPDALGEFLKSIVIAHGDWMAHVFSSGASFERLKAQNLESRVRFHPLVPEENLNELLLRSDIQIVPQAPGTEDGSLPSKLPNIIQSGAIVFNIGSRDGEVASIVKKMEAGITTGSWDHSTLLDQFRSIKDRQRPDPRSSVPAEFSIDTLVQRVLDEFAI